MDRQPYLEPPRPNASDAPGDLRFDALATGTLRGLLERLTRWAVPSGYLGREAAFAPRTVNTAYDAREVESALRPWVELEDQLRDDIRLYGYAFTMVTLTGTRRVEPWRVLVSAADAPVSDV